MSRHTTGSDYDNYCSPSIIIAIQSGWSKREHTGRLGRKSRERRYIYSFPRIAAALSQLRWFYTCAASIAGFLPERQVSRRRDDNANSSWVSPAPSPRLCNALAICAGTCFTEILPATRRIEIPASRSFRCFQREENRKKKKRKETNRVHVVLRWLLLQSSRSKTRTKE